MKTILVTGAAGFIGFHLCRELLKKDFNIIGLDNINEYYDIDLKYARIKELGIDRKEAEPYNSQSESRIYGSRFKFFRLNLEDKENFPVVFKAYKIDVVCNLAAQAGVRYSLENPMVYVESNIVGFVNLLECMRQNNVKKLVYASSSSVYGLNDKIPFSTDDNVDHPISLYAATKKSNELMAFTYSHLYGITTIGLRFFTVYGPWGRPDMAMFLFTDAILNNRPIKVFNQGKLSRDFTYIDDIVSGVVATIEKEPAKKYSLYNIGNGNPVKLLDFISAIEKYTEKTAEKKMLPMQPGDVERTWADTTEFSSEFDFYPNTSVEEGVKEFIEWFKDYNSISS